MLSQKMQGIMKMELLYDKELSPDEAQTVMKRFHSDDEADTFLHKLFERRVDTQRMETADEFWEMLREATT